MNTATSDQREKPSLGREDLDEGDDEAADRRAGRVADTAEDGGREGLQAGKEPEVELDAAEVEALDDARRSGERRGDEERDRDRLVDVDAHELRRLAILGRGAHRPAEPGPADEQLERDHQRRWR